VWRHTTRRAREVIERGMEIGTRSFEMTMAAGRNITQRVRETIEKGYR
jgi:hypothetical protein